ncbi:hypothetical protein LINGRAHAP2_LOCUS26421 [Linum grandiflorum]
MEMELELERCRWMDVSVGSDRPRALCGFLTRILLTIMGFDNECIPNIQSLAGEYFCPVCRMLVYPHEALQSQCTHLYCKSCLAYVATTTQACPYDGYLVTEADSKPLLESNKSLAETIGKIQVHCLYNRSGCTWQGPLSECTTHCSGCAFGNSAVVCNRCGVQIVHRQIHEHAQTCAGVQPQALNADGSQVSATSGAMASNDNKQVAVQAVVTSTQSHASQSKISLTSAQETTLQSHLTTTTPAVTQASVPTSEQMYQQHQYHQQYPGYFPYQQHYQQYYQQTAPQYQQPHAYMQPSNSQTVVSPQLPIQPQAQTHSQLQALPEAQSQSQSQSQMQVPVAVQPQNQAQTKLQQQTQPPNHQLQFQAQPHPTPHGHLHPQFQLQAHGQALPVQSQQIVRQQLPSQSQNAASQIHPMAHSQPQHVPQIQSTTQVHAQLHVHHHQQPVQPHFASQPSQFGSPAHQAMAGHQSYIQPQSHHPMLPVNMYPQSVPLQQSQHPVQLQSQFPQPPTLLHPLQSHGFVSNLQPEGIFTSSSQVSNTVPDLQNPLHAQAHPTGLAVQQRPAPQPVQQPMHQQYVQNQQHFSGQPFGQNHKHQQTHHMQQNMHSHSQLRPQAFPHQDSSSLYGGHTQHSRDLAGRPVVPPDGVQDNPHRLQSGPSLRAMSVKKSDSLAEEGVGADVSSQGTAAAKADSTIKPDFDLKSTNGETKSTGETKDGLGSQSAINVDPTMQRLQEKLEEGDGGKKDVSDAVNKQDDSSVSVENEMLKTSLSKDEEQLSKSHDGDLVSQSTAFVHDKVTVYNKDGLSSLLHRPPTGQTSLQGPPGSSVGNSAQHRPPGPANIPQVGQPLNLICAGYNGSHGSEILPGGLQGPKSALAFSAGLSYYGSSQGPHTQGNSALSKGEIATFSGREGEMFPPLRPNPSINSNATGMNMVPGHLFDSSSMLGLPNERFGPFAGGHLHAFSQDAARRAAGRGQLEEDIKGFSRASDLEASLALKFRGPHGFRGDMIPRAPEDGPYRLTYDSGSNMDTVASHAPSRHFPPYNYEPASHCSDVGEGPIGFHGKPFGGLDLARSHKDLLGPGAGYAQRLVDSFGSRSPGRDYLSLRKFGPFPSLDDVHGRDNKTFDGSSGRSFHDPRFPVMPSHSRRDEFHGLGSSRISDNYRFSEFIGQDGMPNHLRGENFGPHKLSGHLRFTELAGLGPVHGHHSVREYPVNGNFHTARFGEPGFRSSFTLNGFPGGERNYAGELDSFGKSIKRKPSSTGWCRICKVDCETVEGLEVHSQTKEHQNMALDMVVTIKQNAKKQKLIQSNNPSVDDSSNLRNIVSEGRGD